MTALESKNAGNVGAGGAEIKPELDIRDYLSATADASKRSRTITIVMVFACVVVFAGYLNSLQSHWMQARMINLQDIRGRYVASKLGPYPERKPSDTDESYKEAKDLYAQRYRDLCGAVSRAFVDNSLVNRVPFLGFTFDANDLGLLGGAGFLIILACYRFFLTREVNNLRMSFEEASSIGKRELAEFYKLLAMRQVFTVPTTIGIRRSRFLLVTPKMICWAPLMIHIAVLENDLETAWIGLGLNTFRYRFLIGFELVTAAFLLFLSWGVTMRLIIMDRLWEQYWGEIREAEPAKA